MTTAEKDCSGSSLAVRLERSGFLLDFDLEWDERVLVLFGPSGAGKSTLLECILGFHRDAHARIRIDGHCLDDDRTGFHLPTQARELGWVPQAPTLFPHLDVAGNLAFGRRRAGPKADRLLARAVDVLEIDPLMRRSVKDLSGGEQSRVALARALASGPRVLLLDEPLAALDVALRARVLPYLLRVRDEMDLPIIYITHDPDEAMLIGERVAVLDSGRLLATGAPREVLWSHPALPLAEVLGIENVIEGRIGGEHAEGGCWLENDGRLRLIVPWELPAGTEVKVGIPANEILIAMGEPGELSARNILPSRVTRCESSRHGTLVHLDAGEVLVAKLTDGAVERLGLRVGSEVLTVVKAHGVRRLS